MKVVLKPGDVYSIDFNVTLNIHHDVEIDKDIFVPEVQKYLKAVVKILLGQEGDDND